MLRRTETQGMGVSNGAVFWMAPDDAPEGASVLAQLTVQSGTPWLFKVSLQGRSVAGGDWSAEGVRWNGP